MKTRQKGWGRRWFGVPIIACALIYQAHLSFAQSHQPTDEEAYSKIMPFSIPDLQAFAAAFPDSKLRAYVEETMSLLTTLDEIRSGKIEPKCTIPFSALGHWEDGSSVWDTYRRVSPDRGTAGWFHKGNVAGVFYPIAGAGLSISLGHNGQPLWPTGDGSVWGIDSDVLVWLFPGLKVRTQGPLLFAVIYNRGLVCLSGTGTLVFHDEGDREISIK
jgi:hypothetical protein